MGALIGIGALINKNTFEGGGALIRKGALIGRRALNRIITVIRFLVEIAFLVLVMSFRRINGRIIYSEIQTINL